MYKSFEEAREFARSLKFNDIMMWFDYCFTYDKPEYIPSEPWYVYGEKWKGIENWIGVPSMFSENYGEGKRGRTRDFLSFDDARTFIRSLKLKNQKEWNAYCKSGDKPFDIPSSPSSCYSDEWLGMKDWLHCPLEAEMEQIKINVEKQKIREEIAEKKKAIEEKFGHPDNFLSFKEAREIIWGKKLQTEEEWEDFCDSGEKPDNIPEDPHAVYGECWIGMNNWLGVGKSFFL
jgi:hypothetical protein